MYPVCFNNKEEKRKYDWLIYKQIFLKKGENKTMELFFDVETTGMISKNLEFDNSKQAWAIQLAAVLSTPEEVIAQMNVIIQPVNNTMNSYALDVHKITLEKAKELGIKESEAIARFADMQLQQPTRIAHNFDFDNAFIDHMFKRNMDSLTDEQRSVFYLQLPAFCTMKDKRIRDYVDARNAKGAIKWSKLSEMYMKLFEEEMPDAHDALGDVLALRKCYYELQKRGII